MVERYRVPKHKIPVRIRTVGSSEENVYLFLSDFAPGHVGAERLVDLFASAADFLAIETEREEIAFVRRASLQLVRISLEDEVVEGLTGCAAPVAADLDIERAIRVELADGTVLEGVTRYQLPQEQARLQDFLNCTEAFLPLYQGADIVLINKSGIDRVTPT